MKRQKFSLAVSLACAAWMASTAMAATTAQIDTAIENGLTYLAGSQLANGSWSYGGYEPAATGAAVFAMLSQQSHWGANAAAYQAKIDNAIAYLLANASTTSVSTRNNGSNICPGGSGSCLGVSWQAFNNEDTYTTGLVAPALALYAATKGAGSVATSSGPLANRTWTEIAQGITNMFAASQSTNINGNREGGWRYYLPGNGDSDMSTTQWAVIAMIYDQTIGASTPQIVKDDLASHWLPAVQAASGVACYQPSVAPCDHADTGGLLLSLDFVGKSASDPAAQAALNYLNANWTQGANGTWYGNFGQPYAMWAEYKGLELTVGLNDTSTITNLLDPACGGPANPPSGACNWWQDYNQWLVNHQNANGSWTGYDYWTGPLATAFYLPILGGTEIPPQPAPEPATLGLIALGLVGLAGLRRRNAK